MSNNNKTPAIRFKGFTDTWEQRKLGEISESFEYGLNAAATEYDGKHKYIRITDIDDSTHLFLQDNLTSPDVDFSTVDDYLLQKGDVLFARTGASVGKTYIYRPSDGDLYFAGFLIRAKIKSDYDADFIFQNTLTDNYDSYIRITSQRSGQPGVNAQEYANFALSVPCLAEQKKIGAYFTNLDNLITLHQHKYDKLIQFKAAMLKKMFPQNGADKPEIRFKGFTDAWEQRELKELASFAKGSGYSKNDIKEQGTPLILYGRLYTKYETKIYEVDTFAEPQKGSIYSKGCEVIVPASGETSDDIARASYVAKSGILLGGDLNIIYPNDTIEPTFLALSISNGEQQKNLAKKAQGKSVVHLHNSDLETVNIVYPTRTEQARIGQYFDHLDTLITLHQRKCDKYKSIKAGLIRKLFP